MFFDPVYFLFVGPFLLIAMWASSRVKSTFRKYSQVGVRSGMTGAQAAAAVARAAGLEVVPAGGDLREGTVSIERFQGFLSDHYDPGHRALRLSPDVYDGRSVASIAVAAHEVGHAIQHARQYAFLQFRSKMVPVTMFGSNSWIYMFIAGMLFQAQPLMTAGIVLFAITVIFQLVTLPVEFDASSRAKAVLADTGIVANQEEADGVATVLRAAAMTYVASALTAIATLLYLLMRARE